MRQILRLCAIACALMLTASVAAAGPDPRQKPSPDPVSSVVDELDFHKLREVFDAVEARRYSQALVLAAGLKDEDARTLALWRVAREDTRLGSPEVR